MGDRYENRTAELINSMAPEAIQIMCYYYEA